MTKLALMRSEDRGALLDPDGAARLFPPGLRVTGEWVRRRVRPRIKIGRKVMFYEADVQSFIASHREAS